MFLFNFAEHFAQIALNSGYLFYAFYRSDFLDKGIEVRSVVQLNDKIATEKAVVAVDIDASHHDFFFFWDNVCNVAYNSNVVIANNSERNRI